MAAMHAARRHDTGNGKWEVQIHTVQYRTADNYRHRGRQGTLATRTGGAIGTVEDPAPGLPVKLPTVRAGLAMQRTKIITPSNLATTTTREF
jgi:hypothetical protein